MGFEVGSWRLRVTSVKVLQGTLPISISRLSQGNMWLECEEYSDAKERSADRRIRRSFQREFRNRQQPLEAIVVGLPDS